MIAVTPVAGSHAFVVHEFFRGEWRKLETGWLPTIVPSALLRAGDDGFVFSTFRTQLPPRPELLALPANGLVTLFVPLWKHHRYGRREWGTLIFHLITRLRQPERRFRTKAEQTDLQRGFSWRATKFNFRKA